MEGQETREEMSVTPVERIACERAEVQIAGMTRWPKHDPDSWDVLNVAPAPPPWRRAHCWECDAPPSSNDHGYCALHYVRIRLHGTIDVDERRRA
jgi:hypothetical protein